MNQSPPLGRTRLCRGIPWAKMLIDLPLLIEIRMKPEWNLKGSIRELNLGYETIGQQPNVTPLTEQLTGPDANPSLARQHGRFFVDIASAYTGIRTIRLIFAGHPQVRTADISIPDVLYEGKIWSQ